MNTLAACFVVLSVMPGGSLTATPLQGYVNALEIKAIASYAYKGYDYSQLLMGGWDLIVKGSPAQVIENINLNCKE